MPISCSRISACLLPSTITSSGRSTTCHNRTRYSAFAVAVRPEMESCWVSCAFQLAHKLLERGMAGKIFEQIANSRMDHGVGKRLSATPQDFFYHARGRVTGLQR